MTPTLAGALFEAAIILLGVLLLWSHAPFRRTMSATPRPLRWVVGGLLAVWFTSQIGEIESDTYPLMSWHMYGESLRDAPIESFRLRGVDCTGKEFRVPWSGGTLGRRPNLGFAIPRAYRFDLDSGPPNRAGTPVTDSLLLVVLAAWNREPSRAPLCELQLQRLSMTPSRALLSPLPPYETVRTVTGR